MTEHRKRLRDVCLGLRDNAEATARAIGKLAELPLSEVRSAGLLREALREHGFAIDREFPQLPTAFVA